MLFVLMQEQFTPLTQKESGMSHQDQDACQTHYQADQLRDRTGGTAGNWRWRTGLCGTVAQHTVNAVRERAIGDGVQAALLAGGGDWTAFPGM